MLEQHIDLTYPELCRQRIGASSSGTLSSLSIWQTVSAKLRELLPTERDPHNSMTFGPHADPELLLSRLSFSHFAELITIEKQQERAFYEIECVRSAWSVRDQQTLDQRSGVPVPPMSPHCHKQSKFGMGRKNVAP